MIHQIKLQGTKHEASMKHLGQSITQYKLEVSTYLYGKSKALARTQPKVMHP